MRNDDFNVAVIVVLTVAILFLVVGLGAALSSRVYWQDRYTQKHCVAWESTGNATQKCACLDDEPCAKTQEVKP